MALQLYRVIVRGKFDALGAHTRADLLAAAAEHDVTLGTFDLSPEEPMGGMAAMESPTKRLWAIVALVTVSFVGVIAVILTLAYVL